MTTYNAEAAETAECPGINLGELCVLCVDRVE